MPFSDDDACTHYARKCVHCGKAWASLHCPHDGYKNPCPHCGQRHDAIAGDCDCETTIPFDEEDTTDGA